MLEYIASFIVFFLEIATVIAGLLILFSGIVAISQKAKQKGKKGTLIIKPLNQDYHTQQQKLEQEMLPKDAYKQLKKKRKQAAKADKKQLKKANKATKTKKSPTKRVFVLRFAGNIHASAVESLREEITALLAIATKKDEVVVCLESGGGVVHGYGLGASQLKRIKDQRIPLTVCVDKIAASGGYMMAAVADKIIAAPFAILGSIGVVAQLPNFNRFLKEKGVDFEQITAGEYKRTLTLFGKNTDKARQKMQTELDETHALFKRFVTTSRPAVNIDKAATGEHWFGEDAMALGLIDILQTSDDYLTQAIKAKNTELFELTYHIKKNLGHKMAQGARQVMTAVFGPSTS